MDLRNGNSKPAEHSGGPVRPVGRGLVWWGVVVLVVIIVAALLLLHRLNRLENQVAGLGRQVEQSHQTMLQVEKKSAAAQRYASEAETSAQQAAQQSDQAVEAKTKSEKETELAQEQAQAAENKATLAQQKVEQFKQEREEELNRLQKVLGQIADTHRTAMGLIMTLGSNSIRFDFDKATLRPENREILSRIAGVLMTLKGYHISVYGYTDDIGTPEYNLKLSERRAKAVRDYLVHAGLDPNIINTKDYGESDPRVPGDSAKARAINRRVEIGIVDFQLQSQEPPPPGN